MSDQPSSPNQNPNPLSPEALDPKQASGPVLSAGDLAALKAQLEAHITADHSGTKTITDSEGTVSAVPLPIRVLKAGNHLAFGPFADGAWEIHTSSKDPSEIKIHRLGPAEAFKAGLSATAPAEQPQPE